MPIVIFAAGVAPVSLFANLQKNSMSSPFLSVIIPTRNRADLLLKALYSLVHQTLPMEQFEVLVVDNGSNDNTREIVRQVQDKLKNMHYFFTAIPGLHAARHLGMEKARSDILVYTDDDTCPSTTWLEAIHESFFDPEVMLVGGKILPEFETDPPSWVDNLWQKNDCGCTLSFYSLLDGGENKKEIRPIYIWGCNFSIRKKLLYELGGFHPDAMPIDLLKYRGDGESSVTRQIETMNIKALYNPKALVYHWVATERLQIEYIYFRAYIQGISDSYSLIRSSAATENPRYGSSRYCLSTLKKAIKSVLTGKWSQFYIQRIIQKGLRDGFAFHQREISVDPELKKWVLRKNYFEKCIPFSQKRIAFFQARWALQSHTIHMIHCLAEKGFVVDFFTEECNTQLINKVQLINSKLISFHEYSPSVFEIYFRRFQVFLRQICRQKSINPLWKFNRHIIPWAVSALKCFNPNWLIGIEKQGLVWAGMVAKSLRLPYLYYNLELYPDKGTPWQDNPDFAKIRKLEKKFHRQARATIIQDAARSRELLHINGVENQTVIFNPVALAGEAYRKRSNYLHRRLRIDVERKILLYFGVIDIKKRMSLEIANQAIRLSSDWMLVFHGYGAKEQLQKISNLGIPNLMVSSNLCPEEDVPELIASATIGLSIYNPNSANNRLTAFSSEKVALYLKCGIPLIALAESNFQELFSQFRCGELITALEQLPAAVAKINHHLSEYQEEAFRAYELLYRAEKYVDRIADFLETHS